MCKDYYNLPLIKAIYLAHSYLKSLCKITMLKCTLKLAFIVFFYLHLIMVAFLIVATTQSDFQSDMSTASEQLTTQCLSVSQFALLSSCPRLSLPEEWRGIRDEALSKLSGIQGCIFVHAGGFIGGNNTQEGALEMARRTLQGAAQSHANGSS